MSDRHDQEPGQSGPSGTRSTAVHRGPGGFRRRSHHCRRHCRQGARGDESVTEKISMLRIVIVFMLLSLPAVARDNGQWGNQPVYLREWFQKLMQPDNPNMSCCGEADAFEADSFEVRGDEYVAII